MNAAAHLKPVPALPQRQTRDQIEAKAFDRQIDEYRAAKVGYEAVQLAVDTEFRATGTVSDETDLEAAAELHGAALLSLMLQPAVTLEQLRFKIVLFELEGLFDNYYRDAEVVAMLRCDAERILKAGEAD